LVRLLWPTIQGTTLKGNQTALYDIGCKIYDDTHHRINRIISTPQTAQIRAAVAGWPDNTSPPTVAAQGLKREKVISRNSVRYVTKNV
jgi:hypothetical protein